MEAILVNYNFTPEWLLEAKHLGPVTIYDRSDDGVERNLERFGKVIKSANVGNVDYDKLCYLVDNYDTLPDVFLWGKTNLFKYITLEEYEKVKDNKEFTPLLKQDHPTYEDNNGPVCFYSGGMYYERNPLIYTLPPYDAKYFNSYGEFARAFGFPDPHYLPFAPGGNYILTKERVFRYSRDLYARMASFLPYCREPLEAFLCERTYYYLWK